MRRVFDPAVALRVAVVILSVLALAPTLSERASARDYYCFGKRATIVGTNGPDTIDGTDGNDVIVGLRGQDLIRAGGGNDLLCAGRGGRGNSVQNLEWLEGGPGNDLLSGGGGVDRVYGGTGSDSIFGGHREDQLYGDQHADRLHGGRGGDYLNGGNGADELRGQTGTDLIVGDGGDDVLVGGGSGKRGDFALYALQYVDREHSSRSSNKAVIVNLSRGVAMGVGRDVLRGIENAWGSGGNDKLVGDHRPNVLVRDSGVDEVYGRGASDCLSMGRGAATMDGGDGFDYLSAYSYDCSVDSYPGSVGLWDPLMGVTIDLSAGYARHDNGEADEISTLTNIEGVYGSLNQDTLIGDASANHLLGMGDNDDIQGLGGDDRLDGGAGLDALDGGDAYDRCSAGEAHRSCEEID